MNKRIISFLLAVTMVMSLFGFSLSVSAAEVSSASYIGGAVEFTATGVDGDVATVTVRRLPETTVVTHLFPVTNGTVTGTIHTGPLTNAGAGYVLRVFPSADGVNFPIEPLAGEFTVEFDLAGGTRTGGGELVQEVTAGETADLPEFDAPEGYEFGGWASTVAGKTPTTPVSADVTFTAQWVAVGTIDDVTVVVTVSPTGAIRQGQYNVLRTFTAVVSGADNNAVTWEVTAPTGVGYQSFTPEATATGSIAAIRFTVGNNATGTITVTATSVEDTDVSASVTVGILPAGAAPGADRPTPQRPGGILDGPLGLLPLPGVDDPHPGVVGPQQPEPGWPREDMTPAFLLFNDVPMNAWFHDFVTVVHYHGLMHGVGYRTFAPDAPMTRAMFIQVIANLEGVNLSTFAAGSPAFNDVAQGAWYYPAIQWANSEGITFGVGEGYFAPNVNVTREQMAALLNRYANHRNITLPVHGTTPFTDAGAVSYWAVSDVAAIQAAGIIGGFPDGSFAPQQTATRAQVATIFAMFLQATGRA